MSDVQKQKANDLHEFNRLVEAAMAIVDKYEMAKPGSMAFTKLEEAILWSQVLITHCNLKAVPVNSGIVPPIDAA